MGLTQGIEVEADVDPFYVLRWFRTSNPSPYLYFLCFLYYQVVGTSPEQ
ncbi:hypothetical protein, partial [Anaerostipes hadrus]